MIFTRFARETRRCVEEARMLGHDSIGDEDLLLGILRNEDGTAVRMLARLGVLPETLEERLFELRGRTAG